MALPFISVAILNWNGINHLQTYLPSVMATDYPNFEVVIIDNASTDHSKKWVIETYGDSVKWIQLEKNTGYAGGYYHGLKHVTGEIICLLNSDVHVPTNWLHPMGTAFENNPNLGAAQPKILADLERNKFEYAGASGGMIDCFGYPFTRGRIFHYIEEDHGQYNQEAPIFWASGACLFVRKSTYMEAGELDESFFAHMEEIDLCWRIHRIGKEVKVIPSSVVYHLGGGTLNYGSPFKTYLNFRNSYYCLWKNLHPNERLFKIGIHLLLDAVAGVKFLIEGYPKHTWAIVRAHWAFFISSKIIGKKKIGNDILLKSIPGQFSKSIVWAFFIQKKQTYTSLKSDKITY
jgi:GT2 family glycosyltransferase